jgi:hypothetical protein
LHGGSSIPDLHDRGDNDLSGGWKSRVAPTFGVALEVPLRRSLSIVAELDFAGQGGKREGMQPVTGDLSGLPVPPGTTLYADYKDVAKLDYLEIPVLARLGFDGAQRWFIDAGPYVGFLLSAKNVTSGTSAVYFDKQGTQPVPADTLGTPLPPQNFDATTDAKGDLRRFNFGVQLGLGESQRLGPGRIELEVRGGLGLVDLQKDTAANGRNTTGNLVIVLGYSIPIPADAAR